MRQANGKARKRKTPNKDFVADQRSARSARFGEKPQARASVLRSKYVWPYFQT